MGDRQLRVRLGRLFSGVLSLRGLILSLPGVAVLVVGAAWFWLRSDVNLEGARLFVGPYPDRELAFRAVLVRKGASQEQPLSVPLRLHVRDVSGAVHETEATSDVDGIVEFNLDLPFAPGAFLDLELTSRNPGKPTGSPLATVRWTRNATVSVALTQRGGWLEGKHSGQPLIELGLRDGVAAVPFESIAIVRVTDQGRGVPNVPLAIELSGAHRIQDTPLITDAEGAAQFEWIPDEHRVEVSVKSLVPGTTAAFWGVVPVAPGAIRVERADDKLRVLSAVPRQRAFVNLVSEGRIVHVTSTRLEEAGPLFVGEVDLPAQTARGWAVVSSEPDAQSLALVGWPLQPGVGPGLTYDLRMRQLVDGIAQNRLRQQSAHARVRRGVAQFLFALMILEAALLWLHVRNAPASADTSDVDRALEATLESPQRAWLWVTLGSILLGFLALGVFLFLAAG